VAPPGASIAGTFVTGGVAGHEKFAGVVVAKAAVHLGLLRQLIQDHLGFAGVLQA
jgi:hypothetical protein